MHTSISTKIQSEAAHGATYPESYHLGDGDGRIRCSRSALAISSFEAWAFSPSKIERSSVSNLKYFYKERTVCVDSLTKQSKMN